MKTADSIHKITIAAVMRSAMDINSWKYSKVVRERAHSLEREFNLSINELVVFEIRYSESVTLITTQRIIGKGGDKIIEINFDQIDDVVYGNFKGHLGESELSKFRIID